MHHSIEANTASICHAGNSNNVLETGDSLSSDFEEYSNFARGNLCIIVGRENVNGSGGGLLQALSQYLSLRSSPVAIWTEKYEIRVEGVEDWSFSRFLTVSIYLLNGL